MRYLIGSFVCLSLAVGLGFHMGGPSLGFSILGIILLGIVLGVASLFI